MRYSWWEFTFYLVVLMFVLFMQINEYPLFLIVGVVVVTILIAFIKHVFYPLVFDKRIDRLESFLSKQQNTPGTYIIYVLANRLDDEVELVMEQIMQKYKRRTTSTVQGSLRIISQGYVCHSASCTSYRLIGLPYILRNHSTLGRREK
ncbi:hypothetical protein CXK86_12150 [Paenibacillus sp. BGI2013]|nr:hypothetical protein CXK86_12150 [Paenibacillus sp. BGI2013]